jgi:hypothetical protein
MDGHFLVYIIKDQGIPFYVGKGSSTDRMFWHEKYAKNEVELGFGLKVDYNPRKTRKIKKILAEGRQLEYEWIELYSESAAFQKEIELISLYGRRGIDTYGTLMNLTAGGIGGNTTQHYSEEQKEHLRKKRSQASKNRSPETIEKIRQASIGRKHSPEAKAKISAARKIRKGIPSPKRGIPATGGNAKGVRKAANCIQIAQHSLNGELIKIWPSFKSIMDFYNIGEKKARLVVINYQEFDNSLWTKIN